MTRVIIVFMVQLWSLFFIITVMIKIKLLVGKYTCSYF